MRPPFITDADIIRWNNDINQDQQLREELGGILAENHALREVLLASHWLAEELETLNVSEFVMSAALHVFGKNCYNADPWQVAQSTRAIYAEVMNKRENKIT